jgi:plastocyanin
MAAALNRSLTAAVGNGMGKLAVVFALAAAGALGLSACGGDDDGGGAPATVRVNIVKFHYKPATITVEAGGKVSWVNSDVAPHTATAQNRKDFDTGTLKTDQSDAIVFRTPGTYSYICLFHPFMHGTVKVVG